MTYLPRHIRDIIEPYVDLACRTPTVPAKRKDQLREWLDSLPESDGQRHDWEGPITVRISQFSGAVWFESKGLRAYDTVASIMTRCPQPVEKWPGEKAMLHKLVLGTRTLRDAEIIADLLNEQGTGAECGLNLTLCVESLRMPKIRLRNRKMLRPDESAQVCDNM